MSVEWVTTKHFPAGANPREVFVWVQENNHEWVSEFAGVPIQSVKEQYEAAKAEGLICTIKLKWADIKNAEASRTPKKEI